MIVTWTALRARTPTTGVPWAPCGATWWQAGHSGSGRLEAPLPDGRWWSVLATWDRRDDAEPGPPLHEDLDAWHVVLDAASFRGDAVLPGATHPFTTVPPTGGVEGAAAVVTFAGRTPDSSREREFFRRFMHLGRDVTRAPGHVASLLQAPDTGAVLTFSVWDDLDAALAWAYEQPRHAATVARQQEHQLVDASAFLRGAVLSSRGLLGDLPDPLHGRRGTVIRSTRADP